MTRLRAIFRGACTHAYKYRYFTVNNSSPTSTQDSTDETQKEGNSNKETELNRPFKFSWDRQLKSNQEWYCLHLFVAFCSFCARSRFLRRFRSHLTRPFRKVRNGSKQSWEPVAARDREGENNVNLPIIDSLSCHLYPCSRAGHFRYFYIFSIIKNDFLAFFIKIITYFCISPI